MPLYIIVKCRYCGNYRYVEKGAKTFQCPRCGKRDRIEGHRNFGMAMNLEDARRMVVELNTRRIASRIESYGDEIEVPMIPRSGSNVGKIRKIQKWIYVLSEEKGEFSADDLRDALASDGIVVDMEEIEKIIASLISNGILYEPKPGKYATV